MSYKTEDIEDRPNYNYCLSTALDLWHVIDEFKRERKEWALKSNDSEERSYLREQRCAARMLELRIREIIPRPEFEERKQSNEGDGIDREEIQEG